MTMITKNVSEIEEEIQLHGHIEWRSKKELDNYILSNRFEKDIRIVGHITPRTIRRWGLDKWIHEAINHYVGVRNGRVFYLQGHGIPQPIDYSRYYW